MAKEKKKWYFYAIKINFIGIKCRKEHRNLEKRNKEKWKYIIYEMEERKS